MPSNKQYKQKQYAKKHFRINKKSTLGNWGPQTSNTNKNTMLRNTLGNWGPQTSNQNKNKKTVC